ncbi:unnamed protein product [Vitrella brassicaformis CCMP3155]|uniref:Lipoyl-binding domain-containing protein n=1 Tax=Vitrella brassicaformis (strain CCMP3155) TaxID=1169540 RepID=A0A0G4G454_VITBC|nr:unnamed protein product [Vitrella brassicaformis CCMP3155]|eukprot:CEM22676.1 unnamed protein product [Vitrella brassicaformis CCMP3155]
MVPKEALFCRVYHWHVKLNDQVKRGSLLIDADTVQGLLGISSAHHGKVVDICCKKDDMLKGGDVICRIDVPFIDYWRAVAEDGTNPSRQPYLQNKEKKK